MRSDVLPRVIGAAVLVAGVVAMITTLASSGRPTSDNVPSMTPMATLAAPRITTPCSPSLQAEINAAEPGATLDLDGCQYMTGATIDRPLTLIGATVRVPPGQAGIIVSANDVTLDGVAVIGSQAQVFDFNEMGVVAWAQPDQPITGLTIRDSEIGSFGGYGAYLRNVANVLIEGNSVHDVVYAGLMVLSGTGGTIEGNVIRRIGVVGTGANAGNAYGVALTTQGTEPATINFAVIDNTVEDVPAWHALDVHGGQRIVFRGNIVHRAPRGIFVTTSSAGLEPAGIAILANQLLSPAPIDANLAAITLYRAHDVTISGNHAVGWGEGNFLRDFEELSTGVVTQANTVEP